MESMCACKASFCDGQELYTLWRLTEQIGMGRKGIYTEKILAVINIYLSSLPD